MNDPLMHNDLELPSTELTRNELSATGTNGNANAATSDDIPAIEMLGALDIVEAFTALRHELKLQVRSGRETQQAFSDGLQRIEQRIAAAQATPAAANSSESRKLAEAIADIDENLQRAVESLNKNFATAKTPPTWLASFDATVAQAPWLARCFATNTFSALRKILEQAERETLAPEKSQSTTLQGFELLMARVRRQMQQAEIERVDVVGKPFDAEIMNAIDMIDAPAVAKAHVAEQLRPAYRWRGSLLRYADVRLAK
jgi:molecular chaperone GrpE